MILETSWRRLEPSLGPSWGRLGGVLRRIGTSWAALGPSLRRLGASWSLLGASWDRCGTSWKRPASDSNQKFDFFIDFCFQLRPPKPSKSNPRCMESSIFKMRFLKLTSIFVAIMLLPTYLYFELMFNVLGALRASWERLGTNWEPTWSLLGPTCSVLRATWSLLGAS